MTLPALPRQLGIPIEDIKAIFTYLQRIRDSFSDSVSTIIVDEDAFTDEQAQDAVGTIIQDTATIDATYNDVIPSISFSVVQDSSIQKVQVAKNSLLVGSSSLLDFLESGSDQLDITQDADSINIKVNAGNSRYVSGGMSLQLRNRQSLVVSRYYEVDGILELSGDATLEVL